jgi:RNA polymerase sigma factor (sigma-70 family)
MTTALVHVPRPPSPLDPHTDTSLATITSALGHGLLHSRELCHDAEDMRQDAIVWLLEGLRAGKSLQPLLQQLRQHARNIRSDFFRKRARRGRRLNRSCDVTVIADPHDVEAEQDEKERQGVKETRLARMQTGISQLPDEQRVVVLGVYLRGQTRKAYAEATGSTDGQVAGVLRSAKAALTRAVLALPPAKKKRKPRAPKATS